MSSDSVVAETARLQPSVAAASDLLVAARPWHHALWQQMQPSLRAHSLFAAVVAAYVACGWLTPIVTRVPVPFSANLYSANLMLLTAAFLVVAGTGYVFYVMAVIRPDQLTRYLWTSLRDRLLTLERLWMFLPVFLLLPLVISTFTYFKVVIPYLHPFDLDPRLASWDRIVHFGHEPWELLQPVLGYPAASAVINFVYHLWLFVMFGVVLWQAFSLSRPRLRMRYLLCFVLMWALLGNVAATFLSSAGPVYFGRVTGLDDPFAPLMAYLHQASQQIWLPALDVQDMLWQDYVSGNLDVGRGISAMPSLHVATSFSFALLGFATRRWLGILFSVFAAFIFVGSVHLGWHYALDGYVGLIGAWVIWWAVGWFLDRPSIVRLLWGDAVTVGTA